DRLDRWCRLRLSCHQPRSDCFSIQLGDRWGSARFLQHCVSPRSFSVLLIANWQRFKIVEIICALPPPATFRFLQACVSSLTAQGSWPTSARVALLVSQLHQRSPRIPVASTFALLLDRIGLASI